MDVVVIVVIWIIFAIVGAIIKNVSKQSQNSNGKNASEPRRSRVSNDRDDDKEALANLQKTLKQKTSSSKKKLKAQKSKDRNISIESILNNNDTSSDEYFAFDDSESASSYDSVEKGYTHITNNLNEDYKTFSSEIAAFRQEEVGSVPNVKQDFSSYLSSSSNMFEQAIIYDAILNRKGQKFGRPSRLTKK